MANNETHKQDSLAAVLSILLALAIVAIYWQVGNHEFLTYDDDLYIVRNPHVTQGLTWDSVIWAFSSVEHCNWHPITWLSHMLDVQLFGLRPSGHHLMNVAIHCVATLLLLRLLIRTTGMVWRSAFVAALFALHPLHVESVAWAAERKDVLSSCFGLASLNFYAAYTKFHPVAGGRARTTFYALALCSFVLSLMSKPMLVMLPVIMLILDFWPLQRHLNAGYSHRAAPLLKEKIPFFACSILSSAITIYAQQKGKAVMPLEWVSPGLRLENAVVSVATYIWKTIWPLNLGVLYPYPPEIPLIKVISAMAILALATFATIRTRNSHPYLIAGWCWFLIMLLPVIGLLQVGNQAMADRYTYLPSVGLFSMVAWWVPSIWCSPKVTDLRTDVHHWLRTFSVLAGCLALAAYTFLAWRQIGYWRDDITLYRHTQSVTSDNYVITYNLGVAYGRRGDRASAIREFRAAMSMKPNDLKSRNMLAATLAEDGQIEEAIREWRRSLAINPQNQEAQTALEYWQRFLHKP